MMNALQFRLGSKCSRLCGNNVQNICHHGDNRIVTCFHFSIHDTLNYLNNVQISGSSGRWSPSHYMCKSLNHGVTKHSVFTSFIFKPTVLFNKGITGTGSRHFNNLCHLHDEQIYQHEEYRRSLDDLAEYLNQSSVDSSECRKHVLDLKEIFFNETLSSKKWILNRLELPSYYHGLSSVLAYVQDIALPNYVSEKLNQVVSVLSERLDDLEPTDAVHIAGNLLLLGCKVDSPEISKLLNKSFSLKNSLSLQSLSTGLQMFPKAVPKKHVCKLLVECSENDYQFDIDSDVIHLFNVFSHAYQTNQNIHQSTFNVLTTISENPKLMSNVDISSKLLHLSACMRRSPWYDQQNQDNKDWLADIALKSSRSIIEHQDKSLTLFQSLFITDHMKYWMSLGSLEIPVDELFKATKSMTTMDINAMSLDEAVMVYRHQSRYFYLNQKECEAILLRNWKDIDAWLLDILLDIPPVMENPALLALIYQQLMKSDQMSLRQCITVMNFLHTSASPVAKEIKAKAYQCLLDNFESGKKLRLSRVQWTRVISILPNKRVPDLIWDKLYQFLDSLPSPQLVQSCSIISALRRLQSMSYQDMALGQQLSSLSNFYEKRVSKGLNKVNDIQWLCLFIRSLYQKGPKIVTTNVLDRQSLASFVNRMIDLYTAHSMRQRNLHFSNVCQTLWNINYYDAEVFDKLSIDMTRFENCSLHQIFCLTKLLGIFLYTPSNMDDLNNTVAGVINRKLEHCSPAYQLDFMKHLSKANIFPEKQIKRIFTVEFMNKVNAVQWDLRILLIKHLVTLNQCAVLDCPHLNIPWLDLQEKYRYIKSESIKNKELMLANLHLRRGYWQVYITFGEKDKDHEDHSDFVDFLTKKMVNSGYIENEPKPVKYLSQSNSMILIFNSNEEAQTALRFHNTYYKGAPVFIKRTDDHRHRSEHKIHREVRGVLQQLAGKDCLRINAKTQYGYKSDFMLYLTQEGTLAKIDDVDNATDLTTYKRLAVILPRTDYPVNVKIRYSSHRTRHLSKLGYTLIVIDTDIWNSMALSRTGDKVNYLKELIFSSDSQ